MSVFIIAEAGVNHNGDFDIAKKLVDVAKDAGADCVKFQTFVSENIVSKKANKAEYQKEHTNKNETQYEMLKKLELTFSDFLSLKEYCDEKNIEFLSTAFDDDSIDFLASINMKHWKIPSGEITNLPYLIKIAKLGKPTIVSTGMSTMEDIRNALIVLKQNGVGDITVLHCTTEYPAPYEDVNLYAMQTIAKEFNVKIGYSDHTKGIEIPIAATALGATIVEKHFTLNCDMDGPDHQASIEPKALKEMVTAIRHTSIALGNGIKNIAKSEEKNIQIVRKSIIAKCKIEKGDVFSEENLTTKRPGNGISPMKWFEIIGTVSKQDYDEDELIKC